MLYGSKSMAEYAWEKSLGTKPDGEWYYSSGTANIIARIVRDMVGGTLVDAYNFARINLFDKLKMCSAVIQPGRFRIFRRFKLHVCHSPGTGPASACLPSRTVYGTAKEFFLKDG